MTKLYTPKWINFKFLQIVTKHVCWNYFWTKLHLLIFLVSVIHTIRQNGREEHRLFPIVSYCFKNSKYFGHYITEILRWFYGPNLTILVATDCDKLNFQMFHSNGNNTITFISTKLKTPITAKMVISIDI